MGKPNASNRDDSRELVLAYLCTQIDELRAREPGARIDSPDAVHRMRVASRRLRSSLATFGRLFAGSAAQHLRDELLWLGAALGPVRDVEVMRDHLHQTTARLEVDADLASALASLDHELAQRHSRAHRDLLKALNSPRYAALLAGLIVFAADPPWTPDPGKRHTLPALVRRACARVDRAASVVDGVQGDISGPELHEVRKAAKRARYAAEVAVPSVGEPASGLAGRMEDLQEVLGHHQDSLMARDLLSDLAGRLAERQAYALGQLTGLEGASDESVLAEYRQALAAASTERIRDWMHG